MSDRGKQRKLLMRTATVIFVLILTCMSYLTAVLVGSAVESRAIAILNRSDYYTAQAKCIEERLHDITKKAELPESIYVGIFETEEIVNITKEYTVNRLKGYGAELNKEAVKERIRANLYSYLEEEKISKSTISMEALNQYLGETGSIYEQTVNNAFVLHYRTMRQELIKSTLTAIFILVVCSVFCVIFIYNLTKMRRKTLSYINRALIAVVILTAVPPIIGIKLDLYKKIVYSPVYLEGFVHDYVDNLFKTCSILACFWLIIIIILAFAILKIKQRRSK